VIKHKAYSNLTQTLCPTPTNATNWRYWYQHFTSV